MSPEGFNLGAQPLVVQIIASIGIALGAAIAAFRGYRKRVEREPPGAAATVLAAIPDMSPIRALNDTCRMLCREVEKLESSVRDLTSETSKLESTLRDHTHWFRDKIEVDRELCMRLRELKEEIVRSDQQRSRRRVSRPSGP